jgi:hypothetical protein
VTRIPSIFVGLALLFASATALAAPRATASSLAVHEGTLTIAIADDFKAGRAERHYILREKGQPDLRVLVPAKVGARLVAGQKLRVVARQRGLELDATGPGASVQVLAAPQSAAALLPTADIRRALVLLVDIAAADATHTVPASCTSSTATWHPSHLGESTLGDMDGCYADASFNQLGFGGAGYPGSMRDIVHVSITEAGVLSAVCNYEAWANAADTAATAQSVNLANYEHVVYVLPAGIGCGWAGLGYVGCGNNCRAWIATYDSQLCGYIDAYAHELGHNLGLMHASTDLNNDGTIDCEYCDVSDVMGYSGLFLRTNTSANKVARGWIPASKVTDGTAGGSWRISSLSQTNPSLRQVVKVTPAAGKPYYLDYRTAIGYDAYMPDSGTYLNRTNIHRYDSGNTVFVGALADGETLVDAANGLTFSQVSHGSGSALVQVSTASAATCTALSPTVLLTPSASIRPHTAGSSNTYTVSVGNNDGTACSSTNFPLSSTVPAGWTGGFNVASLNLAPGGTGSATFTLTAPVGVADLSLFSFSVGTGVVGSHAAVTVAGSARSGNLH